MMRLLKALVCATGGMVCLSYASTLSTSFFAFKCLVTAAVVLCNVALYQFVQSRYWRSDGEKTLQTAPPTRTEAEVVAASTLPWKESSYFRMWSAQSDDEAGVGYGGWCYQITNQTHREFFRTHPTFEVKRRDSYWSHERQERKTSCPETTYKSFAAAVAACERHYATGQWE